MYRLTTISLILSVLFIVSPVSAQTKGPRVKITNPGSLYSTFDLKGDYSFRSAILEQRPNADIDYLITYANESSWPEGIKTLDKRTKIRESIKDYNANLVAVYKDYVLLEFLRSENGHMSQAMRPDPVFYMIINKDGVENGYSLKPVNSSSSSSTTKAVKIVDSEELYSTFNFENFPDFKTAIQAQAPGKSLSTVIANAHEDKWPEAMNTLNERLENAYYIRQYSVNVITVYKDYILVEVPRSQNSHMPSDMLAKDVFYMVMSRDAFENGSSIKAPTSSSSSSSYSSSSVTRPKIVDPGELYSTISFETTSGLKSAVASQVGSPNIDNIIKYANEKNWPEGMNTLDERLERADDIKRYVVNVIAVHNNYVVVDVRKSENSHMPTNMQPSNIFYMVMSKDAFANGSSIRAPQAKTANVTYGPTRPRIVDPGELYSTINFENQSSLKSALERQVGQSTASTVIRYAHEDNWPSGINTLNERLEKVNDIKRYVVNVIAISDPYAVVEVRRAENLHMPSDMISSSGSFYMVMSKDAFEDGSSIRTAGGSSSGSARARITDPGSLYSTFDLDDDEDFKSAIRNQAGNRSLSTIIKYAHEDNWPSGMRKLNDRLGKREDIKRYNVNVITTYSSYVLLEIKRSENSHMPYDMQPSDVFYMIMGKSGMDLSSTNISGSTYASSTTSSSNYKPKTIDYSKLESQLVSMYRAYSSQYSSLHGASIPEELEGTSRSTVQLSGSDITMVYTDEEDEEGAMVATFGEYASFSEAKSRYNEIIRKIGAMKFPYKMEAEDEMVKDGNYGTVWLISDDEGEDSEYSDITITVALSKGQSVVNRGDKTEKWIVSITIASLFY